MGTVWGQFVLSLTGISGELPFDGRDVYSRRTDAHGKT